MKKGQNKMFIRWGILLLCVFTFNLVAAEDPIPTKKANYTQGIDISHYQGHVNWPKLVTADQEIHFVFMRSTMGDDKKDAQFDRNWKKAGENKYIRGAYHYYRPHENSARQFKNYSSHVKLKAGDFPPILDIEKPSPYGSENLRRGIKNWLRLAEEHYGVKPVIYTGIKFYNDHLKGHVDGYHLWIASYSEDPGLNKIAWTFHQFSDELTILGIRGPVDGNHFKGNLEELHEMRITNSKL